MFAGAPASRCRRYSGVIGRKVGCDKSRGGRVDVDQAMLEENNGESGTTRVFISPQDRLILVANSRGNSGPKSGEGESNASPASYARAFASTSPGIKTNFTVQLCLHESNDPRSLAERYPGRLVPVISAKTRRGRREEEARSRVRAALDSEAATLSTKTASGRRRWRWWRRPRRKFVYGEQRYSELHSV